MQSIPTIEDDISRHHIWLKREFNFRVYCVKQYVSDPLPQAVATLTPLPLLAALAYYRVRAAYCPLPLQEQEQEQEKEQEKDVSKKLSFTSNVTMVEELKETNIIKENEIKA